MHSDEWLAKGWASDPKRPLHDGTVYYRLWRDDQGDVVGIGIDFEWASDVHIELTAAALGELLTVLGSDPGQALEDSLRDVARDDHRLVKVLDEHDITFERISFS